MKNKYEIRGDLTVLYVMHEGMLLESLIDTRDLELVMSFPNIWGVRKDGNILYVNGFQRFGGKKKQFLLHRFILKPPNNLVVDHINHNQLDNRRSNLRAVTQSDNHQNLRGPHTGRKYNAGRGVNWNIKTKKWQISVYTNGKQKTYGYYFNQKKAEDIAEKIRSILMPSSSEARRIVMDDKERDKILRIINGERLSS